MPQDSSIIACCDILSQDNRMFTIIIGTNRPDSNSAKIASIIQEIYQSLDAPVELLDLGDLPPETFDPSAYSDKPEAFLPFSKKILNSSGLVVVAPEYNGGIPGVLKYFIDLLEFPESFDRRPICFVGLAAGQWGGVRTVEHLQQVCGYRNAHIFPVRVFLAGIHKLLDKEGHLTGPDIHQRLQKQADGFIAFVRKLQS